MPNGGKAVLLRSLWVSLTIYLIAIGLKSYCSEGATLVFSIQKFKHEISLTMAWLGLAWLGAIIGASYAALYTRFASQWKYIADLYNQQMALSITLNDIQLNGDNYRGWQVAFIEDAISMHLATKEGFSTAIYQMMQEEKLCEILQEHIGEQKMKQLHHTLHSMFAA